MDQLQRKHNLAFPPLGSPIRLRGNRFPLDLAAPFIAALILLADNTAGKIGLKLGYLTKTTLLIGGDPVLTTDVLVQVLVALLGAMFVLKQIAAGATPHVGYSSAFVSDGDLAASNNGSTTWRVLLASDGVGSATIRRVQYQIQSTDAKEVATFDNVEAVADYLRRLKFIEDVDFAAPRFSNGAAMSPGFSKPLFECTAECRKRLTMLDVVLTYKGNLGEEWVKRVACIPRS